MELLLSDIVMCETVIESSMRAVRRFDSFCRQSESSVAPDLRLVGMMVKQVVAQYVFTTSRYLSSASSLRSVCSEEDGVLRCCCLEDVDWLIAVVISRSKCMM